MSHFGCFKGEYLFGAVDVAAFGEGDALFDRQFNGKFLEQFTDHGIVDIAPELVVIKDAGTGGIEPDAGAAD